MGALAGCERPGSVCVLFGADDVDHGVDQRQAGEGLREVSQVPSGMRLDLLGVQVQRAGEGQQPLAQVSARWISPISTSADTSQNERW